MLDIALNHTEQVKQKFRSTWLDDRYKYYNYSNYHDEWQPVESTWVDHQFVSLKDGEVIGYIGYRIDRAGGDLVYDLNIINFEKEPSMTFSSDLGKALRNIFEKYRFRKLCFSVVVGNPIEKSYDKICFKYGGRVVGIRKAQTRLVDNLYYDEKLYEILIEDYEKARAK